MHDFSCTKIFQTGREGSEVYDQDNGGYEKAKEIAIRMIRAGKMPLEDIANYTELSIEELKELESQAMQTA